MGSRTHTDFLLPSFIVRAFDTMMQGEPISSWFLVLDS